MVVMAANFIKRSIYVLAYDMHGSQTWSCSLFRPSTMTRSSKVIETGEQLAFIVEECVALIQKDKQDFGLNLPLVLRFWEEHYSAFVHKR